VVCLLLVWASNLSSMSPLPVGELVARAGRFVSAYEAPVSIIVSDEEYDQRVIGQEEVKTAAGSDDSRTPSPTAATERPRSSSRTA
jgi:hypothetical protein